MKSSRESRCDALDLEPDVTVGDSAVPLQLFENRPYKLAWEGESQSLIGIVLGHHKADYADQVAVGIDQSASAATVGYGRISLNEAAPLRAFTVATHRADDAHRTRVPEPFRTAYGEHQLSGSNRIGVCERNSGQASLVYFNHR